MAASIDTDFSELLARLYRSLDSDLPWQDFLEALAKWMDASYATLIITAPGKRSPATFLTPGANPAISEAYATSLFADDPFRGFPDGEVVSYEEFMGSLPPGTNAEYRQAMAEVGYDVVLGIDLFFGASTGTRSDHGRYEARFRVSRNSSQPQYSRAERLRLQALVPHLRIAVGLFEKLQFAGAEHGVFHSAAQALGLALLVLDRNRRIVSSNALADRILGEAEGLKRNADQLLFSDSAHHKLVGEMLAGGEANPNLPRFRVERPRHGDLVATARALDLSAIHAGTGALALFLARPWPEASTDVQAMRSLLGLTPAEARLAAILSEGHNLVEAAARLGIAHNTAKVQLRSIFSKTGVRRQSQLVALLASLNG